MTPRRTPVPGPPLRPEAAAIPLTSAPPADVRKTLSYEDVPLPHPSATGTASVAELPIPPGVSPRTPGQAGPWLSGSSTPNSAAPAAVPQGADVGADAPKPGAPDEPGQGEEKPALGGTMTVGTRTTVLPRVEVVGEETRLMGEPRPRFEVPLAQGHEREREVVRAMDNDFERVVALKWLGADARGDAAVARLVGEIRRTGVLEHPSILPVYDVGVDERGEYFLVMRNEEGETLESIIDKLAAGNAEYHGRYPFERRVEVFQKILEAIRFAHLRGVIHRDIRPANVLVGGCGEVVVTGWERAKRSREAAVPAEAGNREAEAPARATPVRAIRAQMGSITGTPAYLAPEQVPARAGDERSDVYSLCVLFHELLGLEHYLSGKTTVEGVLRGVILDSFKPSALVRKKRLQPPVPADLAWFVAKGLRKNPDERYGSVQEMIARLQARREGVIPVQCHLTALKRLTGIWSRFLDRHPLVVTLILALAVASLLGMLVSLAVS